MTQPPVPNVGRIQYARRPWYQRLGLILLLTIIVLASAAAGWRLRTWTWDVSSPLRDNPTATQGPRELFEAGKRINEQAQKDVGLDAAPPAAVPWRAFFHSYLRSYSKTDAAGVRDASPQPPLRLLMGALWARAVLGTVPNATGDGAAAMGYFLWAGTIALALSALAAMALVRLWALRERPFLSRYSTSARQVLADAAGSNVQPFVGPEPLRPWALGIIAGLLIWFNPAALFATHVHPHFDVWILPLYLLAAWLASAGWWFSAGVMLAIGCMISPMILLAAPLLVLWPVLRGRLGAALRIVIGFVCGMTLLALPWLVQKPIAWAWLGGVALGAWIVSPYFSRQRKRGWVYGINAILAAGAVIWPWAITTKLGWSPAGAALALAVALGPMLVPPRRAGTWAAAVLSAGALLAAGRFGGTFAWLRQGFPDPSALWQALQMHVGPVSNLPSILAIRYGWSSQDLLILDLPWSARSVELLVKTMLLALFCAGLVLAGIGAARQGRRDRSAMLIALSLPWLLAFALLPQMNPRHALGLAVIGCILAGVSLEALLVQFVLLAAALGMMLHQALQASPGVAPRWLDALRGLHPDIGWVVLLCAGILLVLSLRTRTARSLP